MKVEGRVHHPRELPVTVVVSRRPTPGKEQPLVQWANDVVEVASTFPGHLSAEVYPPSMPDRPDLVIAFSFSSAATLSVWEHSAERSDWLGRSAPLVEGEARAHAVSGFEGIFSPSLHAMSSPPPRWKSAAVIALALYPASLLISWLIVPQLMSLPVAVRVLITTALVVPFMVWVGVPWLTKRLSGWLQKPR